MKPFDLQMELILEESKIACTWNHHIKDTTLDYKKTKEIFILSDPHKTKTHPSTYQDKFHNIL